MDVNAIVELFRRTVTEHYFDMNGRVGRKEFWWFVAACVAVFIVAAIVGSILGLGFIQPLAGLALLLPMTGMGARRLQDIGRDATLVWVMLAISAIMQVLALMTVLAGLFGMYAFLSMFLMLGGLIALLSLASLLLAIVLIYFWIQPGTPGPNAYGPPPADFDPMTSATPKAG